MEDGFVLIEVVDGVDGPSLYIGDEDTGHRLSGAKPWGGGKVTHRFIVKADELRKQLDEYHTKPDMVVDNQGS